MSPQKKEKEKEESRLYCSPQRDSAVGFNCQVHLILAASKAIV